MYEGRLNQKPKGKPLRRYESCGRAEWSKWARRKNRLVRVEREGMSPTALTWRRARRTESENSCCNSDDASVGGRLNGEEREATEEGVGRFEAAAAFPWEDDAEEGGDTDIDDDRSCQPCLRDQRELKIVNFRQRRRGKNQTEAKRRTVGWIEEPGRTADT
jgi:hypothetical protein